MTNNPLASMMVDDADQLQSEITDRELHSVQALVEEQLTAQALVQIAEDNLAEAKKRLRKVTEVDLPELLKRRGITHMKLSDGTVIDITEKPKASVNAANKEAFHNWLKDNGHDAILKTSLTLQYGKGDHDKMMTDRSALSRIGIFPTEKQEVHNQTLQSWVRECREEEVDLPDLINIHIIRQAKIKKGK